MEIDLETSKELIKTMGNRYLVSGAQLGTLITLCAIDSKACNIEINKIIEHQLCWESKELLEKDILKVHQEMGGN